MNPLQSIIKQLNDSQGKEPAPSAPPAPAATQPPAEPPKPPVPTQTTPAKPAEEPKKDEKPAPQASQIKPEGSPEGQPPAAPEAVPEADTAFNSRLSELTDGTLTSIDDFGRLIDRYNQLEEEAAKGFEPKFKDERAKLVYQLLEQNAGNEPQAAMRILRALDFKKEGKTEKDILFEQYLLDPKNSDLSPMKAQEYFDLDFEQKYGDLEANPLRKRTLEIDVRNALAEIEKVQSDFQVADQPAAQRNPQVEAAVKGAVSGFGGIQLAFSDNPQEAELLKIAIEDPAELQSLQEEIFNPDKAYNDFIGQFDLNTPQGFDDLVRELWERRNHTRIRQLAYEQGAKNERIKMALELRNSSTPGDISKTTPANPAAKSFEQTWLDAVNAKKG